MVSAGSAIATLALAGCSGGGDGPSPDGAPFTATMMQAGVLQPTDIGTTWKRPSPAPPSTSVIPLCGGLASRPPVPGKPSVVTASLADEGEKGAQAFDQVGLVYPDAGAADAAFESLRVTASACPPNASRTAGPREESAEAGYTESSRMEPLTSGGWSGFVVVRHKVYEASSPGTADTAVAVLAKDNAVVVASYAIYWVGQHSTGPEFTNDWRRMVGTVLGRVDAKRAGG